MNDHDERISNMLMVKREEMLKFINKYMNKEDIERIGHDIISIMPDKGDIAKILLDEMFD